MSQECFNYSGRSYTIKPECIRVDQYDSPYIESIEAYGFSVVKNDSKDAAGEATCMVYSKQFHVDSFRIWETYANTREEDYVLRSGFKNYGCHDVDEKSPTYSRPESVAEHTLGTMTLLELIALFHPVEIPPQLYARCKNLMRYHDLGETENGDTPDNGNRNHQTVDKTEYACLAKNIYFLPESTKITILRDFDTFNTPRNELSGDDLTLHELCKLTDKTDAILRGVIYEKKKHGGKYYNVPHEKLSKDETFFANVMQSNALVDIFLASFIKNYHEYGYFPIFLDIIRAAIISIRHKWYPDWEEIIKKLGISTEDYDLSTLQKKH